MDTIDNLIERNKLFAAQQFTGGLAMMPNLKTMIIGCADPRVDPADVLGLEPGDAVVIRNIGGRITPATLQTMAMLRLVAAADPPKRFPRISFVSSNDWKPARETSPPRRREMERHKRSAMRSAARRAPSVSTGR